MSLSRQNRIIDSLYMHLDTATNDPLYQSGHLLALMAKANNRERSCLWRHLTFFVSWRSLSWKFGEQSVSYGSFFIRSRIAAEKSAQEARQHQDQSHYYQ